MTEPELVDELAARTGLPRSDVQSVVTALAAIAREQEGLGQRLPIADFASSSPTAQPDRASTTPTRSFVPSARDVEELIAAAASHPLGLEFLLEGDLCAVAIMFQTHAFTVDAARERIRQQGATLAGA
jgi:hypothetical protein